LTDVDRDGTIRVNTYDARAIHISPAFNIAKVR
jgi:hypothetical protein